MNRRMSRVGVIAASVFAALTSTGAAHAQNAAPGSAPSAAAPARPIVIKAARLFDAVSGTARAGGVIVVQGEKIVSVAAGSDARTPSDAEVIDLGDATLLPGFIDAHTHLTYQYEEDYYRVQHEQRMRFPAEQALYAANRARRTLEAGFTTVRNLGSLDYVDVGLRNGINAGVAVGPRVLVAVYAVGSTGGHCDEGPVPPEHTTPPGLLEGVCNGPEQCREAVRTQMKYGADVIKICASGGVLSESDPVDVPQLTPEELRAIVSEAHTWKRKVAAHSHGDAAARMAVEAGVDSIEHGSFLTESTLKLMKQRGVYLVPTRLAVDAVNRLADSYPPKIAEKARAAYAAHADMFKTALRVGVPIALGTDAAVFPHGINGQEFGLMTDLGMSPSAALLAGTRDAARLLGIDAEAGTLEAGKLADLVAVPGDVLANIRATERPVFVMKQARVVVQKPATP